MIIIIMLILAQCTYIMQMRIGMYNEGLEALRHSIPSERTAIGITDVTPQSSTTVYVKIKNIGSYSIPVIQFDKMEILSSAR